MQPQPEPSPTGTDWTPTEVAAVVADYFAMLTDEFADRPYNKREHNRGLQASTGRSAGSIEFKHQNISAVLTELGLPWLRGYKPRFNYQDALVAEVERHLSGMVGLDAVPASPRRRADTVSETFVLPPSPRDVPRNTVIERLIRKFDPASRDERNRALGTAGEEFVIEVEKRGIHAAGRPDLMDEVVWVSRDEGDGAGYDIRSINPKTGKKLLIEVKTTRGGRTTPFFVTRNEEAISRERPDEWRLYHVFDFAAAPRIFVLPPPLDQAVNLTPATWSASFR